MRRSIIEVINNIIDIIPIENTNSNFIYHLKKLIDYMPYCPLEIQPTLWNRLSVIINENIPFKFDIEDLDHEWQKNIIRIFIGEYKIESDVIIE